MSTIGSLEIILRADIARLQRDMDSARRVVGNATAGMERAANSVRAAFGGIFAGLGLSQLVQMSDQYAKFTAQLRLATQSTREYAAAYSDVKRIASSSQSDLSAVGVLYARIANGTRELGISQAKVSAITETVSMGLKVSGATAQETSSAMLQLSQAFGAGRLNGQEFIAVNEAAPRLMKALADGMGVPIGALKEMSAEGKITSAIMAEVLPKALEDLRREAKEVQTIAGAFTVLKNNVMEFVGVQANASGSVAVLTGAIGLLASNLGLLAGTMLTIMAVKLGGWLSGIVTQTYTSITANQALAASNLATANSHVAATAATAALTSARVAELRAAVLAAEGQVALAITTNGLIPAQARATAAATAHAAALAAQSTAMAGASVAGGVLRGALAFLGGPIGLIITALGIAATAWSVWGNKAKEGNEQAAESFDEAQKRIIKGLDEQIAKNERLIQLKNQGLSKADIDKNLPAIEQMAAASKRLNDINSRSGEFASGKSNEDILFARAQTMRDIVALTEKMQKQETSGAGAAALTQAEARNKFMGEYATKQEQMNAKLKEARALLGESFTAEDKARIRKHYEVKATVSKAASKVESDAEKARLKAAKEIADAAAEAIKIQAEYGQRLGQSVAEANREADANEELVRTFGMSKAAIEAESIARMEAKVERLRGIEMADDEIAALELVIAAKKRSASAMSSVEAMAASKKATEDTIADYEKMSDSIRDSLTDALLRGFESGKSFGRNLIDTLKNMFKTLVLQPTIQGILAPVTGALAGSMVSGTAQAAGTGAAGSATAGVVGGLFGAGGMAGSLMAGAGWLTGATTISGSLAAGASLVGTGTVAGGMAGAGMIVGALAPIALGIAAAVAIWKKLDTSGTYHTGGASRATADGVTTITAESLNFQGTRVSDATNQMTAGLASGIVKILDSTATAFGKTAGYTAATAFADDTSKDGAWGALVIEKMGSAVVNWQDSRTSRWAPKEFGDGEAGQKQYLAALSASVRTALDDIGLPSWAQTMLDGLGNAPSIEDLAKVVDTITATQTALKRMGESLSGFAELSDAAAASLIKASGGIEALSTNASAYYDNFYSDSEKSASSMKAITDALTAVNLVIPESRAEFRAMVEAQTALGESGMPAVAALFKVSAEFARLHPVIESTSDALDSTADALQAIKDAASALMGNVDGAMGVLQRVVDAEKTRLTKAHEVTMKALQQRIDTETAGIAKHKALSDAISSTLGQMRMPGSEATDRASAQAQIQAAIALAKAGGVLPSADSMKDALSVLSRDSSNMFSTLQDYQRDFYQTQNNLAELGDLADSALSVEEKTLKVLEEQKEAAQAAYDAEIGRLDEALKAAQSQIDVLKGIDTSVLSVAQAIEALALALTSARGNPIVGATAGINNAYQTALGRAPDAAGMEFWQDKAASGVSTADIVNAITTSPEARLQSMYGATFGRPADAGGLDFFMKQIASGTSYSAIQDALMQSDEYTKKLRGFAVGTNYVPGDMPAMIHEGERIIPAADNRDLMAALRNPGESNAVLVTELRLLREELAQVKREVSRGADGSVQAGDILDKATAGGGPVIVEVINKVKTVAA